MSSLMRTFRSFGLQLAKPQRMEKLGDFFLGDLWTEKCQLAQDKPATLQMTGAGVATVNLPVDGSIDQERISVSQ